MPPVALFSVFAFLAVANKDGLLAGVFVALAILSFVADRFPAEPNGVSAKKRLVAVLQVLGSVFVVVGMLPHRRVWALVVGLVFMFASQTVASLRSPKHRM